jgi:hypothetical protein
MGKTHRPFAGPTWAQISAVRDAAKPSRYARTCRRAQWSLSKKSVPLIKLSRHGWGLTSSGQDVWLAMQQWRPDLYFALNAKESSE